MFIKENNRSFVKFLTQPVSLSTYCHLMALSLMFREALMHVNSCIRLPYIKVNKNTSFLSRSVTGRMYSSFYYHIISILINQIQKQNYGTIE